ncbi:MAG TPA: SDR family NAD(P)-dependent oxidoreductase [Longimicrobiales bacterium]
MSEKVIVITGASAGIGAALAHELGGRGHRLVLCARRLDALERVAREAEEQGSPETVAMVADVTHRTDVENVRDEAIETFGRVDVWINNAGRGILRRVLDLTDDDIDTMMAINLKSALYGMQAIVPYFIEQERGHVINISSFLGRVPLTPMRSAYSAAKAALNALTANLRVDLRKEHPNVHVSLVMPGVVITEFAGNALHSQGGLAAGARAHAQSPAQVAAQIADLIEQPCAEVLTNPAQHGVPERYYADVAAFEASMG